MYFSNTVVKPDHPLYVEPPKDSVEHVYSAIEWINGDMSTAYSTVCYRTKDGMTHRAIVKDNIYTIVKSVKPFGK
jgi:hypothetical protein